MNSCHEEGLRDQNRAGIEAADSLFSPPPALHTNTASNSLSFLSMGRGRGFSFLTPSLHGLRLPRATLQ
eukprot:gene26710-biopygen17207